jgi:MFS transporter, OFA family, oxalate/formate antiporter
VNERGEFRNGGAVLFAAMIGVMCGASPIPYNTIGFFMPEIAKETGWGFGQMSLGITIYGLLGAALAPVFGGFADRYGVRPVALVSTLLFGIAFGMFAFTPGNIWGYYLIWVFVGLVGIGSTPVTWSRAINLWFFKNRGLALGIMLLGTSFAALIVPKLTIWAIDAYGWRNAHLVLAAMPLLIALPLGFFLFREPRPEERSAAVTAGLANGVSLPEALNDRRFWTIWLSIALVSLAYGGAHIHMPEMVKLHGYSKEQAASVMQLIGIALLAGRVITGFLLDRFWAPFVCLPILTIPAFACFILMGTGQDFELLMLGAFLLGFAAGAESDLIAYLASRYFGMAHYGKIYGMLYMPFAISAAFSPAIYGYVRDATGNYDNMLYAAAGLFVTGALLLLTLGRYPALDSTEEALHGQPAQA